MKLVYQATQIPNPLDVLRKAGYSHFIDPNTNEESFTLRLTVGYYPRFHVYVELTDGKICFNLHLDQKKASYEGTSAHAGEYDGPTVEKEMQRLEGWIFAITHAKPISNVETSRPTPTAFFEPAPEPAPEPPLQDKPGNNNLFGGIFG
ncbi:MAG: hypothetical protein ABH846_01905 [Patescibacteria group bacterium]